MKKFWPFSFYFIFFAAASTLLPYLALYYHNLGLSSTQIGILTGVAPLIALVSSPAWAGFADARGRHRLVMAITLGGVVLLAILIPYAQSFATLLPLIVLYAIATAPIISLADSATMATLGEERALYGRIRMGGTFGWGIIAPIAGWIIEQNGPRWSFWLYAGGMLMALLVSQRLLFGEMMPQQSFVSGFRRLMTSRRWVLFLAMMFFGGVGLAVVTTYLFPFMEEIGSSKSMMGMALSMATVAELPVLFFANSLIKRFHARGLLIAGMGAMGVRLLLYAIFPTPVGALRVQLLHGVTFGTLWVAGVAYAHEQAPPGLEATAQGVFGSVMMGFGGAAGNFLGGILLASVGGQQMYFILGVMILIALALYLLLEKRLTTPSVRPIPGATHLP